jgi:hypothetical protein
MPNSLLTTCCCLAALIASTATAVEPGNDLYIPSVGHGQGQEVNGVRSQWRADLWIFNPSTTQIATVDILLLLRNQPNTTPESRRLTVNPGQTKHLPDVVLGQFGLDNTYGALRVVSTTPVIVTGSSYDANVTVESKKRGVGTAGQFFSGLPADCAIGVNESVDVIGLDQDGQQTAGIWRSNLALVETTGQSVDLEIDRIDANGSLGGTRKLTLGAREARQLDLVLTSIIGTPGSNVRARVRVVDGQGRVLASASRIDNRTGDPSTVEMARGSLDGVWVLKADKTTYDTPLTMTVAGGAVTQLEATVLFTDEDAGAACTGGELMRVAQTFSPPVVVDEDGLFSFSTTSTADSVKLTIQVAARLLAKGSLRGTVVTTLTGAGSCSGTRTWPLVGARMR